MIEIDNIKAGQRVIWLGSAKTVSYGNRTVIATVLRIKEDGRVQIKIDTPKGEMIKFVSKNSLDYFHE